MDGPDGRWAQGSHGLACASGMMALDQVLWDGVQGGGGPILRLYAWPRPALSLGRTQKATAEELVAWRALGLDLCRRPSGGRAVLHVDSFTYTWVEALAHDESVSAAHRRLALGVEKALGRLGLGLTLGRAAALGPRAPQACFATPSLADLLHSGRKLVGAAQARRPGALLQQGSLYFARPQALSAAIFGVQGEDGATDLEEALGARPSFQRVAEAFVWGFGAALGHPFESAPWRMEEMAQAATHLGQWQLIDVS